MELWLRYIALFNVFVRDLERFSFGFDVLSEGLLFRSWFETKIIVIIL